MFSVCVEGVVGVGMWRVVDGGWVCGGWGVGMWWDSVCVCEGGGVVGGTLMWRKTVEEVTAARVARCARQAEWKQERER